MRNKNYIKSILAICLLALVGCSDSLQLQPVVRLDSVLAEYSALTHRRQLAVLDSLSPELDAMMSVLGRLPVTTGSLDEWSHSAAVQIFQPAVDSIFPTVVPLEKEIGYILHNASRRNLSLPPLTFATVVWGNPRPIVRVDSVVLIALNHYLGASYPGYSHLQSYRRYEKSPEFLPYDIAAVLAATQHPMAMKESPALIEWMLYEGALIESKMQLVKDARLDMALGYTPDELDFVEKHITEIWQEMTIQKLIYDTDPTVIDRYIASAPNTPLLGGQTPGRIGRYIGYRIIRDYLKRKSDMSLDQLLSPEVYNDAQTLILSGFNGR